MLKVTLINVGASSLRLRVKSPGCFTKSAIREAISSVIDSNMAIGVIFFGNIKITCLHLHSAGISI